MFSAAPIDSKKYNDVPICNKYSNKEYRNKPIITNEYELNSYINLKNNNNNDTYIVKEGPTIPSPSLYLESNKQTTGYYINNPYDLSEKIGRNSIEKFENYQNHQTHFFFISIFFIFIVLYFYR
jgi:hypothetical protein